MGHALSIEQIPYDILDNIVSYVDVRHYCRLLQLCKSLRERLVGTRYGHDYHTFWTSEPGAMKQLLIVYSNYPDIPLLMPSFFESLKDPFCSCGRFAWRVFPSFPPRRICYLGEGDSMYRNYFYDDRCDCRPWAVRLDVASISTAFNFEKDQLESIPKHWPLRRGSSDLTLVDMRDINRMAGGSLEKLLERRRRRAIPDSLLPMLIEPAVTVGIWHRNVDGQHEQTLVLAPLQCEHCRFTRQFDLSADRQVFELRYQYPYIPYSHAHLREHVKSAHPQLLDDFDLSWTSLPPFAKQLWLDGGRSPSYSADGSIRYAEIETWSTWSKVFNKLWTAQIHMQKLSTESRLNYWKVTTGRAPIWTLPDMRIDSNEGVDLGTMMDAWYTMKQKASLDEFERRMNDDGQREGMWKEIAECYGFGELFPQIPTNWPPTAGTSEE